MQGKTRTARPCCLLLFFPRNLVLHPIPVHVQLRDSSGPTFTHAPGGAGVRDKGGAEEVGPGGMVGPAVDVTLGWTVNRLKPEGGEEAGGDFMDVDHSWTVASISSPSRPSLTDKCRSAWETAMPSGWRPWVQDCTVLASRLN